MFLLMQWETKKWVRGSGVTRDVYSSFWNEAYESLFIGRDDRVPLVRHDFFINEWNAIGKIIYKGYVDSSYFPMLISKSFLCYVLFDDEELLQSSDMLSSLINLNAGQWLQLLMLK